MADFGGRYRRGGLLGAGGMGEVWLAYDEELDDRPVAIKIMHSRMLADPEDVARFQREMRLASRMQHPNIMTLFTTGTDNGVPFMVMEYLDGEDLSKAPPNADPGRVARIGQETCAALAYAHGLGVIHRDIKPSNLFLCSTGLVKVTDFGIARAVAGTRLSSTGVLVGTVSYMAPEQWLGSPPELSNDIWATGCVLYELLSGRLPRDYPTPTEYVAAAARRERVPPLNPGSAPPWLANAVMAMLEPDPRNRPTAAECVDLLAGRAGWAGLGLPSPMPGPERIPAPAGPPTSPRARPPARRRITLAATALAALAAAGGTAAAVALHSGGGAGNAIGVGTTKPTVGTSAPVSTPSATTDRPSAAATTTAAAPATGSQSAVTQPVASVAGPQASGVWIAQLASVPVSAGPAELQKELNQIQAEIPGAQYLDSSDYASLNPGYWVVYYAGSFTDGTQALSYCASHGRTTSNQCVGRYLSHDAQDKSHICFPPGGSQEAACFGPT